MADYKIRILTEADPAALNQARQSMDQLNRSAATTRQTMDQATQSYRDATNPAVAAAGANKKLSESMGDAANKSGSLVNGLKKVGNAIPGFQFAVGALTNVWVLLAAAIVGTINQLKKWDEVVQKNEARIKIFKDLNKEVTRFSDNIKQAKLDFEEFNRQFDEAVTEEDTPTKEGERAEAAARAGFASQRAKITANKELAAARIDRQEASGEITAAQADKARSALGITTESQLGAVDLAEKKELSDIKLLVASSERFRADELRGQLPGAQAAVIAARNKRDDAARALSAAQEFGGFDVDLNPIEGGRAAELQKQIANLKVYSLTPNSGEYMRRKTALEGELASLRSGVLSQRELVTGAESELGAAQSTFSRISSGALAAGRASVALRSSGRAEAGEAAAAAGLAADLAPIRAATQAEQENAAQQREAARLQAETMKELREVIKSLGQGLSEARGMRQQASDIQSRSRSNIQSE